MKCEIIVVYIHTYTHNAERVSHIERDRGRENEKERER